MIAQRRRALMASLEGLSVWTIYIETYPNSNEYAEYSVELEATWEEWVNSDYNTNGFYCSGDYVYDSEGRRVYNDHYYYSPARPGGFIENNHYYYVNW